MEEKLINIKQNEKHLTLIKIIGGAGINTVNHMFNQGIHGVVFVVCDTDIQALRQSKVKKQIQLGKDLTDGRDAECLPERGKLSTIESLDAIKDILQHDTCIVFITAGMGGGTGTGAAPEIARLAKEMGILTIGIVTTPFSFEGKRRIKQAKNGIDELEQHVDALFIVKNERDADLKIADAFVKTDNVLTIAVKSIAEIRTVKGYVNIDFDDIKSVMRNSGVALMGVAEGEGENRAMEALECAMASPLLNSNDIRGASNVLLNILHGHKEVTMDEIGFITDTLREKVGKNVNVIWEAGKDEALEDRLRVTVIATGFNNKRQQDQELLKVKKSKLIHQ